MSLIAGLGADDATEGAAAPAGVTRTAAVTESASFLTHDAFLCIGPEDG